MSDPLTSVAAGLDSSLASLQATADRFGASLTTAFAKGIAGGEKLDVVLRGLGERFIAMGVKAGLKPIEDAFSSLLGNALSGLRSGLSGLLGTGAGSGPLVPFADGGVIAAPSYFPLGRGMGLAGEAGPEAILPLSRGPDGRLGVRAGGSAAAPVSITIQTPDVESFRRAQAQVAADIARAVSRGQRAL